MWSRGGVGGRFEGGVDGTGDACPHGFGLVGVSWNDFIYWTFSEKGMTNSDFLMLFFLSSSWDNQDICGHYQGKRRTVARLDYLFGCAIVQCCWVRDFTSFR